MLRLEWSRGNHWDEELLPLEWRGGNYLGEGVAPVGVELGELPGWRSCSGQSRARGITYEKEELFLQEWGGL